jgi:hypothetical protein
MSEDEFTRVQKIIAEHAVRSIARTLIVDGTIDPAGKTPDEIGMLTASYIVEHSIELQLTITHEEALLDEARRQRAAGQADYAVIFYATWLEHTLNGALQMFSARHELANPDFVSMVRSSLRDKMGVLWRLVTGETFPAELRAAALQLADARNAFIHYKWQPAPDEPSDTRRAMEESRLDAAEDVVARLTALVDRLTFGDNDELAAWASHRPASEE